MTGPPRAEPDAWISRAVELAVRLVLIGGLAVACLLILRPFIIPVVWGAIISVAMRPLQQKLAGWLGGRARLSAVLLTSAGLILLLLPLGLFAGSMVESLGTIRARIADHPLEIPPPPPGVAGWPVIGAPVFEVWNQAATDLDDSVRRFAPQLRAAGRWLLGAAAGTGVGVAQFVVSLLIAGFLLASSAGIVSVLEALTRRLAGDDGERYLQLAVQTVRSVAAGILGVAILQSMLLGVGFAVVGLPHAGLWTVLCLALAILQLPTGLVAFPAILYVFSVESTVVSVIFAIWTLLAGLADNVLKPLLLGRGGSVPMLVIFMGAIGGFLASGFLGLFIGAIVLSLGYEILLAWVQGETGGGGTEARSEATPVRSEAASGSG